jgi:hypothetical protein
VLQLVRQRTRWLAATVMALAAVGAFLAWGPIGLGNGPLWVPTSENGVYSWGEPRVESVGYVLPIGNNGGAEAIIDTVAVTGRQGLARPVLLKALTGHMTTYACTALGPFGGRRSTLTGCVRPQLHSAIGAAIRAGTSPALAGHRKGQPALVLKLSGPPPGKCSDITSIVIHYHIGIRHYSGTFPQGNVITCGVGGRAPGT